MNDEQKNNNESTGTEAKPQDLSAAKETKTDRNAPDKAKGPGASARPTQPRGNRPGMRGGRRGPGGRGGRRGPRQGRGREKPEFESKTLDLARVSRVTKGGKRFSFRATVVAGDQKGRVGVGVGKGKDVQKSIQKAYAQAKKNMMNIIIVQGTIPYQVEAKFSSAKVILKPSKGGIKAGGAVRIVAQLAGIHSLTGKNLGRTNNKLNIARATLAAFKKLRHTEASRRAAEVAKQKEEAAKQEKEKKENAKNKDAKK